MVSLLYCFNVNPLDIQTHRISETQTYMCTHIRHLTRTELSCPTLINLLVLFSLSTCSLLKFLNLKIAIPSFWYRYWFKEWQPQSKGEKRIGICDTEIRQEILACLYNEHTRYQCNNDIENKRLWRTFKVRENLTINNHFGLVLMIANSSLNIRVITVSKKSKCNGVFFHTIQKIES